MTPMDVTDLVDLELVKRLKYRYLRCLDQKLWDEIGDCFTADAVAEYSAGAYSHHGRDAIVEFLRTSMGSEDMLSSHRCHHPEIDFTGTDDEGRRTATGIWALEDTVLLLDWDLSLRGAAWYHDRYVKVGEDWRISHTGYRRTFEEVQSRQGVPGLRLTAHWWATGGRSELEAG